MYANYVQQLISDLSEKGLLWQLLISYIKYSMLDKLKVRR